MYGKVFHFVLFSLLKIIQVNGENLEDYCQYETFQPKCQKNEVILMKTAVYGRMQIGRCITAEEVNALGPLVGEDPRYLGCSADVLAIVDKKCSGNSECEVRLSDIATENIRPCFPGLIVYLEVSYDCINTADLKSSCVVSASRNSLHIAVTSASLLICGNEHHPLIIESAIGQKISIGIIHFPGQSEPKTQPCQKYGTIVEKSARKNTSICGNDMQRETKLYQSMANRVEIIFDSVFHNKFLLKFEALGCLDIVPPEDTWLKRNDDLIVIGCYSNRQTWRLSCRNGRWNGVLGNCTTHYESNTILKKTDAISYQEQVLTMFAISGCTLAVCFAIVCFGALCLRRFYSQSKKNQPYKTIDWRQTSQSNKGESQPTVSDDVGKFDILQLAPTYSVFVGDGDNETIPQMNKQ